MLSRATLLVLTAFWLVMNVLLWRAEYGAGPALGSTVPTQLIWDKVLTAPDSSSLTIFRRGKKIGFCQWVTSVGEDLGKMSSAASAPEGMVRRIADYRLELNGTVVPEDPADRVRFDSHLRLSPDRDWKDFGLRLSQRTDNWELSSVAADQNVRFRWQDDGRKFSRVFSFAELQHPEALIQEFGGPLATEALRGLGWDANPGASIPKDEVLRWEGRYQSVKLGHSSIRVYRLKATLLNHLTAVVFVSRVGEILRVELPDGIVLANDQLGGN